MDDRLDEKYSRILEGMFRGITAKIKEAQASMEKEFRYGVSQQGFSHDALSNEMKEEAAKLLTEVKYLAQQNIDIYDYSRKEHAAMQESLLRAMDERNAMLLKAIDEKLASPVPVSAEVDYDLLAEKVAAILRKEPIEAKVPEEPEAVLPEEELVPEATEAEAAEPAGSEPSELAEILDESTAEEETAAADASATETPADFDDSGFMYDILAEKIASILPEPDYDIIADKVAASLPDFDADLIAQKVAEAIHTDPEALAGELAEAIPPVDYELISEKVAGSLAERAVGEDTAGAIARRVAELLKGEEIGLDRAAMEAAPADTAERPCLTASSARPSRTFRGAKGSAKQAVPTATAEAPASMSWAASSPEDTPPMPRMGSLTALETSQTIRTATGRTAGPDRPPVFIFKIGRRVFTSIRIPRMVLMRDRASAPAPSAALAISTISVTLGESFTITGTRPAWDLAIRVTSAASSGLVP